MNRLWPAGMSKAKAALSEWRPDWAPTWRLRQWLDDSAERWPAFCGRYREELLARGKMPEILILGALSKHGRITLVYTGSNPERNIAVALLRFISGG